MKSNKKRLFRIGLVMTVLGLIALAAAGVVHYTVHMEEVHAEQDSEEILFWLEEAIAASEEKETVPVQAGPAVKKEVYQETCMEIDGEQYLGYLSFTGYDLTMPVFANWDFDKLKKAPARYFGTVGTDTLVIAGHNYKKHFNVLNRIAEGNEVVLTDAAGHEIHYVVREIENLQPTAIEKMVTTDWDLTLFTCTYRAEARRAVRCERMTHGFGLE